MWGVFQGHSTSANAAQSSQSSSGVLDKIFKSKKSTLTASKSKPEDKPKISNPKKEKSSVKSSKTDDSKLGKPPTSGIPKGGLSSRSRTPSRESLAKCRIQPPGSVTKSANRLSSDSGIHSPAENKLDAKESGLVRNNSLPSSRIHSTKDTGLSRQSALRSSTNSPISAKKDLQRSLPKTLSSSTGSR